MTPEELEILRFPIGKYEAPEHLDTQVLSQYISEIASFPDRLRAEVSDLNEAQLNTPYRPEGWTIRQVVHHCADSHMNSIIRFKLALTEEQPVIKPYFEDRWAELQDSTLLPVGPSLALLDGLHLRWVTLLRSLTAEQLERTFIHPEHKKAQSLKSTIALYAWHGNHHLAQITTLKKKNNWN